MEVACRLHRRETVAWSANGNLENESLVIIKLLSNHWLKASASLLLICCHSQQFSICVQCTRPCLRIAFPEKSRFVQELRAFSSIAARLLTFRMSECGESFPPQGFEAMRPVQSC